MKITHQAHRAHSGSTPEQLRENCSGISNMAVHRGPSTACDVIANGYGFPPTEELSKSSSADAEEDGAPATRSTPLYWI